MTADWDDGHAKIHFQPPLSPREMDSLPRPAVAYSSYHGGRQTLAYKADAFRDAENFEQYSRALAAHLGGIAVDNLVEQ